MHRFNLRYAPFAAALAFLAGVVSLPFVVLAQAPTAPSSAALGEQRTGPLGLDIELRARVTESSGDRAEIVVADGGVLRSGDKVQIRMTTARDAYVYLVAKGSSGRAVLLRPFSQRSSDARLNGGQVATFPPTGGFLPLDDQVGYESVFAIAADRPLTNLGALLNRMEGAGGDPESVTRVVAGAFPASRRVAFQHVGSSPLAGVDEIGGVPSPPPSPESSSASPVKSETESTSSVSAESESRPVPTASAKPKPKAVSKSSKTRKRKSRASVSARASAKKRKKSEPKAPPAPLFAGQLNDQEVLSASGKKIAEITGAGSHRRGSNPPSQEKQ